MKKNIFIAILLLVATLLIGCATPRKTTQLVEHITRDTIYLNRLQYDSIFIRQDCHTDRTRDTILVSNTSVEYRYRLLRDTVRIAQRDSIPYEVAVVETKETVRPLSAFDYITRAWFFVSLAIAFAIVFAKLNKP